MRKQGAIDEALHDIRHILAVNLTTALRVRFRDSSNRPVALSQAVKIIGGSVSKSAINRLMKPKESEDGYSYPSLKMLVSIALGLKIEPFELLVTPAAMRKLYGDSARGDSDDETMRGTKRRP